jgi:hypothetical protein
MKQTMIPKFSIERIRRSVSKDHRRRTSGGKVVPVPFRSRTIDSMGESEGRGAYGMFRFPMKRMSPNASKMLIEHAESEIEDLMISSIIEDFKKQIRIPSSSPVQWSQESDEYTHQGKSAELLEGGVYTLEYKVWIEVTSAVEIVKHMKGNNHVYTSNGQELPDVKVIDPAGTIRNANIDVDWKITNLYVDQNLDNPYFLYDDTIIRFTITFDITGRIIN